MIIIAHSNYNGCSYCAQSHGTAFRLTTESPTIADQVAVNYHEADKGHHNVLLSLNLLFKVSESSESSGQ